MKSAKHVVKYLGRYTHRIAISNARIKKYEDNKVTFSYKDYSNHNKIKEMTLEDTEFFRRYMMHVLPSNFMKIRHYGFLGNRNKEERIQAIRTATNTKDPGPLLIDYEQIISDILKRDVSICIKCGQKRMADRCRPCAPTASCLRRTERQGISPRMAQPRHCRKHEARAYNQSSRH